MAFVTREIWIGIVMLVAAFVYWIEASKIRVSPLDDGIGAAGMPNALAYALGVLAIILILQGVRDALLRAREAKVEDAEASESDGKHPHLRAIGMLAIGVGYLLLISKVGYIIAIGTLLFTVSIYIGAKFNLKTAIIAVVGAVFYHLMFVEFLGIPLPPGDILGPLLNGGN